MDSGILGGSAAAGEGDHLKFPSSTSDSKAGKKPKRHHRHTVHQIQRLEAAFNKCPHPDEKQRILLGRELNLAPRQIKFWFQNRRTQMKGQQERANNCVLRAQNDKIRCENIAMCEALRNVICPTCGGPPLVDDLFLDEQNLKMQNALLRQELDRVSSVASKFLGRPSTQIPPARPLPLDLSVGTHAGQGMHGPLDFDLQGTSSVPATSMPLPAFLASSDTDKTLMAEIAVEAADELHRLLQTDEPLWVKSPRDGRDVLNFDMYQKMFRRANNNDNDSTARIESSRDSGVVDMNSLALIDMFMNPKTWLELFPTIVSVARIIEVLSPGILGNQNGALQLMYAEMQVLSPLVPTREFYFLRYCQQIQQGLWIIADVSCDFPRNHQFVSQYRSVRLPSGCLIQETPDGYSKVIWVERVEIQDKNPPHTLYKDLIHSGFAFGAERWLATLQRVCERFVCFIGDETQQVPREASSNLSGKRCMMKLTQRMIANFCATVSPSDAHSWTTLADFDASGIRITARTIMDPGQPVSGVILSAATTIWLPICPQNVFSFFKNEQTRGEWDVLSHGNHVQEIAHVATGSHPGNCISVLHSSDMSQGNMVILQETCIDPSGSLVVFCPVDLPSINRTLGGQDPSGIPLFPSGLAISPDGRPGQAEESGSSSVSTSNHRAMSRSNGSLITLAFQILLTALPSSGLNLESTSTVSNLLKTTIQRIKVALNCPDS